MSNYVIIGGSAGIGKELVGLLSKNGDHVFTIMKVRFTTAPMFVIKNLMF
jgi:short-subunit dehydrogenase